MTEYQIRDDTFGLALHHAANAHDALLAFVAAKAKGDARGHIKVNDDGTAEFTKDGTTYRAIPLPKEDA